MLDKITSLCYNMYVMREHLLQNKIKGGDQSLKGNDTMTKKMTKIDRYNVLLTYEEVKADEEMVSFIEHEIELLQNKRTNANGEKKLTAQQIANAKVAEMVKEYLSMNERATIGEMFKNIAELPEDMTTQRLTAIVSAMVRANEIDRTMDKRVAYFALK